MVNGDGTNCPLRGGSNVDDGDGGEDAAPAAGELTGPDGLVGAEM
jgi:hypothetical protein